MKKLSVPRMIALIVCVLTIVLIIVLATRPAANDRSVGNPLVGTNAPPIEGVALDGRRVNLAQLHGRYVVVNFFATWCSPCRQEHPELKQFADSHQGANSPTVLAVAFDKSDFDSARSFSKENGGDWPVVPDGDGSIALSYGVRGLPESFVVDPDGRIAARVKGQVTSGALNGLTGGVG